MTTSVSYSTVYNSITQEKLRILAQHEQVQHCRDSKQPQKPQYFPHWANPLLRNGQNSKIQHHDSANKYCKHNPLPKGKVPIELRKKSAISKDKQETHSSSEGQSLIDRINPT